MLEAEGYQGALSDILKEGKKQGNRRKKKVDEMLLEEILSRPNMLAAYDRVTGNKGAAGIDGVEAKDFKLQLDREWVQIKSQLQNGSYQPQAVKRVTIPKPNGGERHLGTNLHGPVNPTSDLTSVNETVRTYVLREQLWVPQ
jgi:RNA-directed DNA polymerase